MSEGETHSDKPEDGKGNIKAGYKINIIGLIRAVAGYIFSPAIIVGAAIGLFSTAQELNREYLADANRMVMLHDEIDLRITELKSEIGQDDQTDEFFLKNVSPDGLGFVDGFPEVANRSTTSIIRELESLVRKHRKTSGGTISKLEDVKKQIEIIKDSERKLAISIDREIRAQTNGNRRTPQIMKPSDYLNGAQLAKVALDGTDFVDDHDRLSRLRQWIAPLY